MWQFATIDLEQKIVQTSMKSTLIASVVLIVATSAAIMLNKHMRRRDFKKLKLPLFLIMISAVVINTFILAFNTVYLNVKAESKGPVHWHADIEFWACGSELELRDPIGTFSNKIGTSTYHEHDDKRIHLEGVVVEKKRDASLGKFMEVTGGYIHERGVGIPLNTVPSTWLASEAHRDGDRQQTAFQGQMGKYVVPDEDGFVLNLGNGSPCGQESGELQVFVHRYDKTTKTYRQEKLADPAGYALRDESTVPPGDCIIVEFDTVKTHTDKLCTQYGVRDSKRCPEFGVDAPHPELCNLREVTETEAE